MTHLPIIWESSRGKYLVAFMCKYVQKMNKESKREKEGVVAGSQATSLKYKLGESLRITGILLVGSPIILLESRFFSHFRKYSEMRHRGQEKKVFDSIFSGGRFDRLRWAVALSSSWQSGYVECEHDWQNSHWGRRSLRSYALVFILDSASWKEEGCFHFIGSVMALVHGGYFYFARLILL